VEGFEREKTPSIQMLEQGELKRELGDRLLSTVQRLALRAAIGTISIMAVDALPIAGLWEYSKYDSGQYVLIAPQVKQPATISNVIKIVNWNTESENANPNATLRYVEQEIHPDVILGQEVTRSEARKMRRIFPSSYEIFAVGKNTLDSQAFGNVILSDQQPEDVQSRSIDGTSLLATWLRMNFGFIEDVSNDAYSTVKNSLTSNSLTVNTSISNIKNGLQESRDIVSAKFSLLDEGVDVKAEIATTHISGSPSVSNSQRQAVLRFMERDVSFGELTIICGDFNTKPAWKISDAFGKYGFVTLQKKGKHASGNGDYCSYTAPGVPIESISVTTLNFPGKREHWPLELDIKLPD
jgi:endonuclease/exonuclease/phosphatase family metal-dependent hydrolase